MTNGNGDGGLPHPRHPFVLHLRLHLGRQLREEVQSPAAALVVLYLRKWYLQPVIALTKADRIAKHKSFLSSNWEVLAAFAWDRYQRDGRGMVVVPEEDFVHAQIPKLAPLRINYAAKDSDLLREVSAFFEEKEWSWLDSYDPDQKVIVVVLREGGGTSGYLIGGTSKPSEAYAKLNPD